MSGPLARSRSARRSPTATTAAAPSPNSAVATRPDTVGLASGWVSEQTSTDISTATSSGDPGIQRRHRNAGDRRGGDHVDVVGLHPRLVKRAQQRLAAKVYREFNEDLVRRAEVR